jgi:hypothetical protein
MGRRRTRVRNQSSHRYVYTVVGMPKRGVGTEVRIESQSRAPSLMDLIDLHIEDRYGDHYELSGIKISMYPDGRPDTVIDITGGAFVPYDEFVAKVINNNIQDFFKNKRRVKAAGKEPVNIVRANTYEVDLRAPPTPEALTDLCPEGMELRPIEYPGVFAGVPPYMLPTETGESVPCEQ